MSACVKACVLKPVKFLPRLDVPVTMHGIEDFRAKLFLVHVEFAVFLQKNLKLLLNVTYRSLISIAFPLGGPEVGLVTCTQYNHLMAFY